MTIIVGGLRTRLIRDSLYNMLRDGLTDLDWFQSGRPHLPITMRSVEVPHDEQIELNTIALADTDRDEREDELGSNLAEHRWTFYVDFFAESDVIGQHLINDVRDILSGRFVSIGRSRPHLLVYNYTLATPVPIFYCELEDIAVDRAHGFPNAWQKHWYSCRVTVVDFYGAENDPDFFGSGWFGAGDFG